MFDDIPRGTSNDLHIPNLYMNDLEFDGTILYELLDSHSKAVTDFGLPSLSERLLKQLRNKEVMEGKSYNREKLAEEVVTVPRLNADQKNIYDLIMVDSAENRQELISVYGHGGTGKKFLWQTIINLLRSHGKIVLAVSSSGIASLLLPSGRTTHSSTLQNPTAKELQQKAIVCPRNETADIINTHILRKIKGESIIYKCSDEAIPLKYDGGAVELLYPMEYLNTLQFSGFSPHELELKVGTPIMLLRNVILGFDPLLLNFKTSKPR
uniref:ATP-dependent DNA helicase n=1 Tax=Tanacetum cinerariifolium TaxID=118510 RepID=A0A6L2JXE8_TANCI|nr:DNA helicase [Tanacetum cinerariifolium]